MSTPAESAPRERDALDLHWLLEPIDAREFLGSYWEARPLHIHRAAADHYDRLFRRTDLDRLLSLAEMSAPIVDVIERSTARDAEKELGISFGSQELDALYAAYARGATLKWRYLDNKWRPLASLCQHLEQALSGGLGGEMYLTPPRSQAFAAHFDRYHFFVLQIEGTKHWRIYDEPFPFPRAAHAAPLPAGKRSLLATYDLEPGDLLYLPRGYYHDAHTTERSSLSIHVGVHVHTWFDAIRTALEDVEDRDPDFRRALPPGFATRDGVAAELRAKFAELLQTFVERANVDEAIERLSQKATFVAHQPLDGFFADVSALDRIALESVVRKRAGLPCRLVVEGSSVTLVLPQRRIKGPLHIEAALRHLLATDEVAVGSFAGGLSDDAKIVLARRLVREGFLTLAGDRSPPPRAPLTGQGRE